MLDQGLELESLIKTLKGDLDLVWDQMNRDDHRYKSAAQKYLTVQDPRKEKDVSASSSCVGSKNRGVSVDFLRVDEVDRERNCRLAVSA